MLDLAGLAWFVKRAGRVRPTDFLDFDEGKRLEFVGALWGDGTGLRLAADGTLCLCAGGHAAAPLRRAGTQAG